MNEVEIAKRLHRAVMIARGSLHPDDNPGDLYWNSLRDDPFFDEDSKAEFLAMAQVVMEERARCLAIVETNMYIGDAAHEIRNGSSLIDG